MTAPPSKTTLLERENQRLRAELDALRRSEARYRRLHETRMDGFARASLDGRLQEVNDLFCRMVGYSRDELLAMTYRDLTPEKWHAIEEEIIQEQVVGAGRSERYEKEYRRKDGTVFPVELRTFLVPGAADEAPEIAAVVRDITARKRGEQALRESEEKFKTAFLTSVDACYIGTLADGMILEINPAFETLFGYSRDEAIDHTSQQLGLWANYADRLRMRERLLSAGFVQEMETTARKKGGEPFACSLSTTALHMQGRHCVIGVVRDISERKRAEEALKASEEQYRLLFDEMLAGLIVLDVVYDEAGNPVDYRFVTGNPAYERMTGHRVSEDRGRNRAEWSIGWPPEVERQFFQVAATGVPIHYERFNQSLGRWYDTRVFSPRRGQFALVFTDVTERKAAEAALREAEQNSRDLSARLISAQEAERSRFARELHDDFSQRLALLAVNLHLLRQPLPPDATVLRESITDLYAQVQSLARDMRRMSHDLHPARLEQLGLVSAIRGLCEELSSGHGVTIRLDTHGVSRDIPDVVALCLYRVAQEALQNVIRHSGASAAVVELTMCEGELRLVVTDEGRGFDAGVVQPKHGVGLASIRERVRAIAGRFAIDSGVGRGTRIEVRAPVNLRGPGIEEPVELT